jgi:hypothetical protein
MGIAEWGLRNGDCGMRIGDFGIRSKRQRAERKGHSVFIFYLTLCAMPHALLPNSVETILFEQLR